MDIVLQVFVIYVAAKLAAEIFVRLRLPQTAGELLAGIVLGPGLLGVIHLTQTATTLSELGIVMLLFTAGLETRLSDLLAVGRSAVVASVAGMALAGGSAAAVLLAFGQGGPAAAFAGTALAASSVGVAARIFADMGLLSSRAARVVLGAAVVDDIVTLAALPVIQGLHRGGVSVVAVGAGIAGAVAFVALVAVVGSWVTHRHGVMLLDRPRVPGSPFVVAMVVCLGLAALAEQVGLAALIGAFLAGMVLAETKEPFELDRQIQPLAAFLVPFFFVVTGAHMRPGEVAAGGLGLAATLAAVTVVAKLTGCGIGALGLGRLERLQVGAGMVPRIEVTLVVASAGVAAGAMSSRAFSAVVTAVLVSAVGAPPLVRWAAARSAGSTRPEAPPDGRL